MRIIYLKSVEKMMYIGSLFLLLFLFSPAYARFSTLKFDHISIENGLSQSTVFSMAQDKTGFMWFGTMDGLNRYDGYKFTTYRHIPFDSTSLTENVIHCLYFDVVGNLWIGTGGGGLNRFDPVTETFSYLPLSGKKNGTFSINTIIGDRLGSIWIGTGRGLFKVDRLTGSVKKVTFIDSISESVNVQSLLFDKDSMLWIGSGNHGLYIIRRDETSAVRPVVPALPDSLNNLSINCLFEDKSGQIWVGTESNGLILIDRKRRQANRFKSVKEDKTIFHCEGIQTIEQSADSTLWIGARFGLYAMSPSSGEVWHIRHQPANPHSISDNSILSLYEDKSGILWIGTWAGGINKYSPHVLNFKTFVHQMDVSGIGNNIILSFHEDQNKNIYVGTNGGGLFKFDLDKEFAIPIDPALKVNDMVIQSIVEDNIGRIWLGTWSNGVNVYDPQNRKTLYYKKSPQPDQGPIDNNIHILYKGSENGLWLGTAAGLSFYDFQDGTFSHRKCIEDTVSQENCNIWAITEDSQGRKWIGTFGNGLFIMTSGVGKFLHFNHQPADSTTLSNNNVWCIFEDSHKNIWVGTSAGLNRFQPESETFTHYFESDGLPNNCIYGILEDASGVLWLSTNGGLSLFDPDKPPGERFRNFDIRDGLQSNEFNMGAYYKCDNGMMLFGGINGFNYFNPEALHGSSCCIPVVLTKLTVFNEPVVTDSVLYLKRKLKLLHHQNAFSVEFSLLDFANSPKNQYRYRLIGLEKEWRYTRNYNVAGYTNLDPGNYLLQIQGANHNGVWSDKIASLSITISPPFWVTWWFRGIWILGIIGIAYALYQLRVGRLISLERLRTRIASDLHDEIGSSLTRIAIYSELIQSAKSLEKSLPISQKIGTLSREIISIMGDVVWSIDARNDRMNDLIDRMHHTAFTILNVKNISIEFNQEGLDGDKKLAIDVRQNLFMIFKEAIHNIAKHSQATTVKISLRNTPATFQLSVQDNGIGFNADTVLRGNGIKNMKMRAERIGYRLEILSNNGTVISLTGKRLG